MAEDSPTVHVQNGRVQVFYGLFCGQSAATVGREGTWQPVRCPRLPSPLPPQSGGRAEKLSGRWLPLPAPWVGHTQIWV